MIKDELIDVLDSVGPMTMLELTQYLGRNRESIFKAMRKLMAERKVYICEWRMPTKQGSRAPVYALGDKSSVPEPPRLTRKEVGVRFRQRHRATLSIKRFGERSRFANIWRGLLAS